MLHVLVQFARTDSEYKQTAKPSWLPKWAGSRGISSAPWPLPLWVWMSIFGSLPDTFSSLLLFFYFIFEPFEKKTLLYCSTELTQAPWISEDVGVSLVVLTAGLETEIENVCITAKCIWTIILILNRNYKDIDIWIWVYQTNTQPLPTRTHAHVVHKSRDERFGDESLEKKKATLTFLV